MIYVYSKNELVYVTPELKKDEKNPEKLLYSFFTDDILAVFERLRPWKCIDLEPGWYTKDCINHLSEIDLTSPVPEIRKIIKSNIWEDINKGLQILQKLKIISEKTKLPEKRVFIFFCDLKTYLTTAIGFYNTKKLIEWVDLSVEDKDCIYNLSKKITEDAKLDYLKTVNYSTLENIYSLLPASLKLCLVCMGIKPTNKNIPEFKNPKKLGGEKAENPEKFLQEEVYNIFHQGEKWEGKDIKTELSEIYSHYPELNLGNPKVTDLEKYFEMSFFMFDGKGKYNLIQRLIF